LQKKKKERIANGESGQKRREKRGAIDFKI
jgi:hypothetical protein